jgi:hypothetical protein
MTSRVRHLFIMSINTEGVAWLGVKQPLLHLFHSEAGAGLWRRAVDESLRHAEVRLFFFKPIFCAITCKGLSVPNS